MPDHFLIKGFEHPDLLFLVPIAWGVVILLAWRSRGELPLGVLATTVALRGTLLSLLVVTLAAPYARERFLDPVRWVVVRDVSASVPESLRLEQKKLVTRLRASEDRVELEEIRFADGAVAGSAKDPKADASDPRGALQLARAALKPDRRNRIVFLTDGRFSRHLLPADWPPLPPSLANTYRPPSPPVNAPDPRARALLLPPRIDAGAPFLVEARFISDAEAEGEVVVEGVSAEPIRRPVRFTGPGERYLSFRLDPLEPGTYPLRITLTTTRDREPRNNVAEGTLTVGPHPEILVLDDAGRQGGALKPALEAQGFRVRVETALPFENLAGMRAVVVRNRERKLTPNEQAALRAYVEGGGGGLLLVGGPLGKGLLGYEKTALADLLPVTPLEPPPPPPKPPEKKPDPKPPEKKPKKPGKRPSVFESKGPASSLTMLLLIDRSGSMVSRGPGDLNSPIHFACEAAIQTAETLQKGDRLGVLAYDRRPHAIVPLGPVGDRRHVERRIRRISAGGGTAFLPVLDMAYRLLRRDTSRIKHVILLTDGQRMDDEQYKDAAFRRLVRAMVDRKITLSTVGLGSGIDTKFLADLSAWGRGRFWPVPSARNIPRIYTMEVDKVLVQAGRRGKKKKGLNPEDVAGAKPPAKTAPPEKPEPPEKEPKPEPTGPEPGPRPTKPIKPAEMKPIPVRLARPHPALAGLPMPVPVVYGLDPSKPKPVTWTAVETKEGGEPVLATRPYGLGKVMVLTTDLAGAWSADWIRWPGFSSFAAQAMRYLGMPPGPRKPLMREGRRHPPELDLTGPDAFNLARLDKITGTKPLPDLVAGRWPGEPERSRKLPLPKLGLLLALLLLPVEVLLRRLSR